MRHRWFLFVLTIVVVGVTPALSLAVQPHPLFSDNMVLQQGMKVPVWGTADDGEKVTVRFQAQEVSATAKDGKWMVKLDTLKSGSPGEMTIEGKNKVTIKNVLVGEVWVASGQSNMEWSVNASAEPMKVKADAKQPMIRFFRLKHTVAAAPKRDPEGNWVEVSPETIGNYSAVAYHFARGVLESQKAPVGIIQSAWGGTICEAWTSKTALEADPSLKGLIPADIKPTGPNQGTALYNGMIAPLIPYAIKGAIWYQGESNAGRAYQYRTLFPAMIKNWRADWGQGDFPFLFVQLAPYMKIVTEPQESNWAELREAQSLTAQKVPNTAQAVITDVGDEKDIHPKQKAPVGERLALAARALAYGEKVEYSGPVYADMKVEGNKAILRFTHLGGGLVCKNDILQGFAICGEDRKWVNAEAEIKGDHIAVSSPQVERPVAVRYGWADCPVVNLYNKAGLPASPFRTDDFPRPKPAPK